ncbi:MAG: Lrp/AsnC family transcriptional regulator [Dehalococcoidia bacterium]|nr:Lrp/AsnC family transcriptional regulator [Dehalococcoidia bacterium]
MGRTKDETIKQEFDALDQTDVRLIAELETDPRQPHTEIAQKLGMSRDTVRARLQRLLDTGAVRIVGLADPISLGFTTSVIMGINVRSDQLPAVADKLASLTRIQHLILCMGRFDIIASGLFRRRTDFLDFLVGNIGNLPGVLHIESMLILRNAKIFGPLLSDAPDSHPAQPLPAALDSLDLALIKELQVDARQNSRWLARKLGTSQSTVLRKIQALQNSGVMRVVALVNPLALGFEGVASIGLKFDPAKVDEAAGIIGSYRNVQTVAVCAGRYDVLAWAMFRELGDLANFITVELGNLPGLQHAETMTSLKIVKSSHRYLAEDALPSAAGAETKRGKRKG